MGAWAASTLCSLCTSAPRGTRTPRQPRRTWRAWWRRARRCARRESPATARRTAPVPTSAPKERPLPGGRGALMRQYRSGRGERAARRGVRRLGAARRYGIEIAALGQRGQWGHVRPMLREMRASGPTPAPRGGGGGGGGGGGRGVPNGQRSGAGIEPDRATYNIALDAVWDKDAREAPAPRAPRTPRNVPGARCARADVLIRRCSLGGRCRRRRCTKRRTASTSRWCNRQPYPRRRLIPD